MAARTTTSAPPTTILPHAPDYFTSLEDALKHRRMKPKDWERRLKWQGEPATTNVIPDMIHDLRVFSEDPPSWPGLDNAMTQYAERQLACEPWLTCSEVYARLDGFLSGWVWYHIEKVELLWSSLR